jgi:hypothetical protein
VFGHLLTEPQEGRRAAFDLERQVQSHSPSLPSGAPALELQKARNRSSGQTADPGMRLQKRDLATWSAPGLRGPGDAMRIGAVSRGRAGAER